MYLSSWSWWWTGRPGVLRFMGLQRVRQDWATELNWTECICCIGITEFSIPWPLMPNLYTCLGFQFPEAFWLFWGTPPLLLPSSRTIFDVTLNTLPVDSNSIGSGVLQAVRSRRGESLFWVVFWAPLLHALLLLLLSPHLRESSLLRIQNIFNKGTLWFWLDPRY